MTRGLGRTSTVRGDAASGGGRSRFYARTALCGALYGLAILGPTVAHAVPDPGLAQVNAGGGLPTITSTPTDVTVNLNAPRTLITWATYNLSPDESVTYNFGARDWIVLNKIASLSDTKIEGTITGKVGSAFGGNIWFISENNIIFGSTAKVDAGGFLASIGTINESGFLDPSNNLFSFSGDDSFPGAKIMLLSGGAITGHGGLVAFAGPKLVTRYNAMVTASDGGSVLYGGAKTFQIRLAPGSSGDFDLVDFIVPTASGGTDSAVIADLAGVTTANSVFVAAVSKSAIGSAVINLEGMITAQAATSDGGDIILSGGGGISNRRAGDTLDGAAGADMYLNKASASRDLEIKNIGRLFAHPWPRPPDEAKNPTTLAEDSANSGSSSNGSNSNCFPNSFCAPIEVDLTGVLSSSLFNPASISTISVGRDASIAASASIELGRIVASRDISVSAPSVTANNLIASGALTATATGGDVKLAGVGVVGDGVVSATGEADIDAISAPKSLTVTAGSSINLGDGTSSVSGLVTLQAAQAVTLNLASAKVSSVTAGAFADLRGGDLDIGSVTAPQILAQAGSVKIGSAVSAGDIHVASSSGDATITNATAGDDIYVLATHGTASIGSATLTGKGADSAGFSVSGITDTAGNGRVVSVQSTDLDARLGLGTGGVTGATTVSVTAGRDAVVDVTANIPGVFQVTAAEDATLRAPTVSLDAVSAGRDLTLATTVGDLNLTTPLSATRNISISAAGALQVGDVTANAGSILLSGSTVKAGAVTASDDLTLMATTGGVSTTSYSVGRDLIVQGTSLSLGSTIKPVVRDLSITSLGDFTSTTALSAGRNLTLDVAGKAVIGPTTAAGTLRIVANDLDLTGAATAANAQIESKTGALHIGAASGSGGLVFDQNDYNQLHVSGVTRFYAGSTTGTARGDLTLGDLAVSTANTPNVQFLAAPGANAVVQGTVAPSASGGILRIGDSSDLNWRPGSILVSGALGAATYDGGTYSDIRAFDEVHLAARNDILLGSQRFIGLIQATAIGDIDTAAGKPDGVAPTAAEVNRIFVSTGRLEVSAVNKVVQQNTSAVGGVQPVGVFFTGKFTPALVIDPPKIVQLWGAFADSGGKVVSGAAAGGAISFTVVDSSGASIGVPSGASYQFNSCDVGTTNCSVSAVSSSGGTSSSPGDVSNYFVSQQSAGVLTTRDGLPSSGSITGPLASGDASSSSSQTSDEAAQAQVDAATPLSSPPVLLSIAPVQADEVVNDPVTAGAGNEEIWRQRRQQK